ncbi:MAG: ABC transporter permease [Gemmatimonadales bacterium]|nr:ABC transporter permease [Gemmatimonadales bacterium]
MALRLTSIGEGIVLAFDTMRVSKLRSALTILGVIIGVTTVMVMASLVNGIQTQIVNAVENAAPQTFYVMRFMSTIPLNPDRLPPEVKARKVLDESDAEALRSADQIRYAGLWIQTFGRMEREAISSQNLTLFAADNSFLDIRGGTLVRGRFFSKGELAAGTPVAVIEQTLADLLFGRNDPIGEVVRMSGRSFTVIGVYVKPDNIFQPPGTEEGAVVPYRAGKSRFRYDETQGLFIAVLGQRDMPISLATDAATVTLRRARGLRPGQPNSFDVITQDQVLDTMESLTSAFFLVMIALSSVALLVGGIGVMAIMMVSVTDRTHEIGIRKALGATKNEILWQFLVEAATLTGTGGALGIVSGLAIGGLLKLIIGLDAGPPIWSAVVAAGASVTIGLVFGMIPAMRAARMDPVEALRWE